MPDRNLLTDVADAVASRQAVDWERCAEQAGAADRGALEHLRTFERISRATVPGAGASVSARGDGGESRLAGGLLGVLVAVALVESAVGLAGGAALLPAATGGMLSALAAPEPASRVFLPVDEMAPAALVLRMIPHVLYPVCGLLLLAGGRFDRRARLLGAVLLLLGAFWAQPVAGGLGWGLYPELFLPAVLWWFVREFPRVQRRTRLDGAASWMVVVSAAVGVVLQVANLPPVQALSPMLLVLAREVPGTYVAPTFFGPHCALVLAALAVLLLRARNVAPEERARTGLFVAGIVAALAPHVEGVVEVAFPGTVSVAAANWASGLGSVSAVAVPCLTLYAAVALRVLDVRTTVRVSARRLLTRAGLGLLTSAPLAALGLLFVGRADLPVREVLADPLGQGFVAAAGAALALLAFRERLVARLDGWIAPESAGQREALAAAVAELGPAVGTADVEQAVARAARRGAGVPAALLAAPAPSDASFEAPGPLAPLPRTSMLAGVPAEVRSPIPVDPEARHTAFAWLPPSEAAWVRATGAAVVAPVAGSGAAMAGVLVAGRRADGTRLRPVDLTFLEALAAAAGLALGRLGEAGGPAGEAPPALACRACGRVVAARDAGACCDGCGGAWAEAPVPALVAGKFVVERRIGAGGMGTVYRARDVGLDRIVAIKALAGVQDAGPTRLQREAQAMAAPAHPAIAQVHGLEAWRGRPLLVMEHLDGGTLAERLTRGALPPADAVEVALAMTGALDALHAAGYRHGDVKPGNVGFTATGAAKLLDFGLAELAGRDRRLTGGTVSYLSPEALGGRPVGVADDVWALAVVLYEMVAGRRPFDGTSADETVDAIRRQRLQAPAGGTAAAGPGAPESDAEARAALLQFAGEVLTAPGAARPATAEALSAALHARFPGPLTPATAVSARRPQPR